jgi:hypothetical protein
MGEGIEQRVGPATATSEAAEKLELFVTLAVAGVKSPSSFQALAARLNSLLKNSYFLRIQAVAGAKSSSFFNPLRPD